MSTLPNASAPAHVFDASIFREYDIRGVAHKSLRAQDVQEIAYRFGCGLEGDAPLVCLGRDGRLSSPELAAAAIQGLVQAGCRAVDIGLGPTPMLYYAATVLGAAGGIMITGSHNPPDYNGMKFMRQGKAFYGAAIQALAKNPGKATRPHGAVTQQDMREEYTQKLLSAYDGTRALRLAWDAGNGATGEIMSRLCAALPGEHHSLNSAIDGHFPSHHPDPTVPENLLQLQACVRDHQLDAGIAFDGDGDRLGVIDDEGAILWGDQLLMLYAADILRERPGATIIADVKASGALFEEIARLGGNGLMWKTGHSLIKSKMAETGAVLAGEMSGHLFFADRYYGFDDALYAAVRLIGLLSRSGRKLSDLRKALPKRINTPELRFECDDLRKFDVIREVEARLMAAKADFSAVDGVRVNTADGWWLLRASNTQPMLVARCESSNSEGLERLKEALRKELAFSNVALP